MNNNRKIIIPIVISVVVIILAVIAFVILGINEGKPKNKNTSVIQLGGTPEENTTSEKNNNTTNETDTTNEVDKEKEEKEIEPEIGDEVPDYCVNAAKKFAAGYMDKDKMQKFIDECLDPKAYVAYDNVERDDAIFLDEYSQISDDDEAIEEYTSKLLKLPETYESLLESYELMKEVAEAEQKDAEMFESAMDDLEKVTGQDVESHNSDSSENTTNVMEGIDEEDLKIQLVKIDNPIKSEVTEEITAIDITLTFLGDEEKLRMVFFGDIVIYICGEDGSSIIDDIPLENE